MSSRALVTFYSLIAFAVFAGLMVLFTGHAHAAEASPCQPMKAFVADMEHVSYFTAPIPARNFPAALALMVLAKKQAPADAALYIESPKQVSGVAFSSAGCVTGAVVIPVPPERLWQLRGILLGERL